MADLESIARLLLRGGASLAESARAEAQRVVDELRARGDLGVDEAEEIEAAVREAVEANTRWLDERVVEPLRGVWRGATEAARRAAAEGSGTDDEIRARLAALEERLTRIERRLGGGSGES
jgi:polyhydroxyalkanoate synthesis regulator phasin